MYDFGGLNRQIKGAFLGEDVCVPQRIFIQDTNVKIRYRVSSKSSCKIVFKSEKTNVKHKLELKKDNREHYARIKVPESGFYHMYVSNRKRDFVQYDIKIISQ